MGLEPWLDEIIRAGTGQPPTPDELADEGFRMRCVRAAYGVGYAAALLEPEPPDVEEALIRAEQDWLRLPVC